VGKETFRALFGEQTPAGIDFTALDRLMPHPVYAKMYWVSVINPSDKTVETVKPLIAEARSLAAARDKNK
jgi:predicted DNA-binding protein (MmcQ/YjbR family)